MREGRQYVIFRLGDAEYALPVSAVREIVRHVEPRTTSSPLSWALGVVDLRGAVVQVLDLARILGVERSTDPVDGGKVLVLDGSGQGTGLLVDQVVEIVVLPPENIELAPLDSATSLEAIANLEGRLVLMLSHLELMQSGGA